MLSTATTRSLSPLLTHLDLAASESLRLNALVEEPIRDEAFGTVLSGELEFEDDDMLPADGGFEEDELVSSGEHYVMGEDVGLPRLDLGPINRLFLSPTAAWQRFHARTRIASPEVLGLIPEPTVPVATPAPAPEPTITAPEPAPPVPVPAEEPAPPAVVPATPKAVKVAGARSRRPYDFDVARAPPQPVQWDSEAGGWVTDTMVMPSTAAAVGLEGWRGVLRRTRPPVQCTMKIPLHTCRTPARSHCREGKP
ncbi:hypothetical protein B0H14DRAFT_3499360 [Mycena olivaceomarginata]|nr:hypothetical protein B0H14DRAFT_3499360 [Mycena olivaceomarginata]